MLPETFLSILNARPFDPQPRHAETVEITLADILTTEDQDARETAQLAALAVWLKESN